MDNRFLSSYFFPHQMCFIIWVLLIVLCKIKFCLTHCYSFLEVQIKNLNLKFYQMNHLFEFFDIHMSEITITCYDCHGFKWKNIETYLILTIFLCDLISFLVCWIVTTPHLISILSEILLCCVFMLATLKEFMSYATSC